MRELREFDLELALKAPGTLREDVQNQAVAIEYPAIRELLEIALLAGSQGLIDKHDIGAVFLGTYADFLGFARPDEILRIRPRSRREHETHAHGPRGCGECFELGRIVRVDRVSYSDAHQDGAFATARTLKQLQNAAPSFNDRRLGHFAVFARRQTHVARGHNRGNGVFVNHLADAVSEQDDELIEGIDLALEFDAVHEVDRDGHTFFAQGIEKWILQGLATGHGRAPCF
jgi:hypothetical protein